MSTGLSLTDLEQAFGNWDDAPLSFEDLPPAAQPEIRQGLSVVHGSGIARSFEG
jgi:hypothetical protein